MIAPGVMVAVVRVRAWLGLVGAVVPGLIGVGVTASIAMPLAVAANLVFALIQRYMFMLFLTSLLVTLLSWIAFAWIGLENAGAWATAASLLHIIPYVGPVVTAGATGLAAFLQFDSLWMALFVSGASVAIATIVGIFVTTWMTGKIAKINAAAVFIALLFWSWLWGVWGMLLGIPILFIVKVISQHVEQLHPVAELRGE